MAIDKDEKKSIYSLHPKACGAFVLMDFKD
jgi:hypothetical protein